jgi:hypothetical protein
MQGMDIDTVDLSNYTVRVPGELMDRQYAARLLAAAWWLWVPLVVDICLGVVALAGRWWGQPRKGAG